mmetsp:Transcript_8891/g.21451  ORF Transcript_8891/g.21451 Transcript_8891/m.21451 type:complete len:318 (+) Transcript_8891:49-1002(+)
MPSPVAQVCTQTPGMKTLSNSIPLKFSLEFACRRAQRIRLRGHQWIARSQLTSTAPEGVAVVHMYENLTKPELFDSFLEGLTHVAEVARYHPDFRIANIHTCLDQEALDQCAPFSYLNFTAFAASSDVTTLEQLSDPHKDWMTSMEFGHDGQTHHPLLMREAAALPDGSGRTPLQKALCHEFSCEEDDVVVVIATQQELPVEAWEEWSGAGELSRREDFRSAAVYEAVDAAASKYPRVVRAEFRAVGEVDLDTLAEQLRRIEDGSNGSLFAVAYRSLVHITKEGQPVDILFAERAKRDQQQRQATEAAEGGGEAASA